MGVCSTRSRRRSYARSSRAGASAGAGCVPRPHARSAVVGACGRPSSRAGGDRWTPYKKRVADAPGGPDARVVANASGGSALATRPRPISARSGLPRPRVLIASALVAIAVAVGAVYAIGRASGPDVSDAQRAGALAGRTAGARSGADRGFRTGYTSGRKSTYREAYKRAYGRVIGDTPR